MCIPVNRQEGGGTATGGAFEHCSFCVTSLPTWVVANIFLENSLLVGRHGFNTSVFPRHWLFEGRDLIYE